MYSTHKFDHAPITPGNLFSLLNKRNYTRAQAHDTGTKIRTDIFAKLFKIRRKLLWNKEILRGFSWFLMLNFIYFGLIGKINLRRLHFLPESILLRELSDRNGLGLFFSTWTIHFLLLFFRRSNKCHHCAGEKCTRNVNLSLVFRHHPLAFFDDFFCCSHLFSSENQRSKERGAHLNDNGINFLCN